MIEKSNFKDVLTKLKFEKKDTLYVKKFDGYELQVDFKAQKLVYPEKAGLKINERQTCNFKQPENFVVFECVHRLLSQGYQPKHIELEPKWKVGHGASGGRADILIKDNDDKALLIIECKTADKEFKSAWEQTLVRPTQLFTYMVQARSTKYLALYTSDYVDGKVVPSYYLLNMTDNESLLQENPKLKSYKEATEVEDIYAVWSETYKKERATIGLFEDNKPYEIGKSKFKISDLHAVSSKDIQGKYHQFATILRQHNVSGRENAFDKLVNLFLCKVVDEKENPDELKFYWKGWAFDNPFDFQDRLQRLYKRGMEAFLGETITYIDNQAIDEAFEVFKDKPNATKAKIKQFLREQKFFTNNDFAFIDVHNEKLFYQNFEVLLKIALMIQDISLSSSDENQFLGDMFEGFLDQGVKQSEGQFFTPMPIVKFIINSLPKRKEPKTIDYACGAGHFLNEYAAKHADAKIVGVEKEYRLSKVAKVSSFMYGNEMQIVYADALMKHGKLQESSFDVLVANPPYSVKGFLQTLSEEEREAYELIKFVDAKSYVKTGAIECFFIERAQQLLKKDAVAAIIVPSSILNKETPKIYTGTREILLKHFEIVAVSEFGSGTFGKTGTNTVTLFLRRRGDNPPLSEHYQNMVNTWFSCDKESNEAFKDSDMLLRYCNHIEIDTDVYEALLCNRYDERLFEHETFSAYKEKFEKLSETKQRRTKKGYKALEQEEQQKIEHQKLLAYMRSIEKDKLYYFMLAASQSQEVVIVKSPSKTAEIKKFLGYEWSSAKGNEGIKYLASVSPVLEEIDEEELESEDKRVLENLQGLNAINTPLYNPHDWDDPEKINTIIRANFEGKALEIPQALQPFVSRARLVDMLDFSQVEFDKTFHTSPKFGKVFHSKWSRKKLYNIASYVTKKIAITQFDNKYYITTDNLLQNREGKVEFVGKPSIEKATEYKKRDILISNIRPYLKKIWIADTEGGCSNDVLVIRTINQDKFLPEYLYYVLSTDLFFEYVMSAAKGVKMPRGDKDQIMAFEVPAVPIDIQKQIIKECQKVDDKVLKAKEQIEKAEKEIKELIFKEYNGEVKKLSDIVSMKAGKFISASEIFKEYRDSLYPCYGGNGLRGYVKNFSHEGEYSLIGRQGALCGNVTYVKGKFYATEHAVVVTPIVNIENKWLHYKLVSMNLNQYSTGRAQPGLSVKNLEPLKITIPPKKVQKKIVEKVEQLEQTINKKNEIIYQAPKEKEEILRRYLEGDNEL